MAVYQNSTANLGVKLEITHASPDIANNRTTITYKASVYKTGSHNPKNGFSQTPMYLTINGESLLSTTAGNYNLEGSTTSQLIKTGTLIIPHGADGSKSFTFSWNVNFTSTNFPYQDFGYRSVTTSGTYVLPNIARASTFTIPSTTITTGSAFTVTITSASGSFTHKVSYIVGSSEAVWTSSATTTYSATVPHALFNFHKSTASVSGVIRVTTMNGSVEVGSNQRTVTINLISSATPGLATVSYTNSNKGMFTGTNQFIRNVSLPTITAGTATGSYSSTISSYEFQTLRADTTVLETISKTTNSQQFGAFNFPNSGSEAKVYMQARVRDSRGRYSGWVKTPELRVHYYAPPAIGTMTVRRTGSGNTTLQVTRNYVVTNMFEGGGTTNINTASLTFQHRVKGTTAATNNTGAGSATMTLSNSNANLALSFAANTSYEVRAILVDKLNTVYGSWISVGTEFVPMDIGPQGVGVGKVHSNGAFDLEVGSGGIRSEGGFAYQGKNIQMHPLTVATTGSAITVTGNWNDVIQTGFYQGSGLTNQSPGSHAWKYVRVTQHNSLYVLQESVDFSGTGSYFRVKTEGNWSGWKNLDPAQHFITVPSSGTHLNSMVRSGAYRTIDTNGSMFPNGAWSQMLTIYGGNDTVAQMGFPYRGENPSVRAGNPSDIGGAGSWGTWKELAYLSNVPTITSGTTANGNWYNINGILLICWYRFSITGRLTASQMNGSWTYPMPYAYAPAVSIGGRADNDPSSTNGYRRAGSTTFNQYNESTTKTDILYAVNNGDVPATGQQKFLNIFAIGTPA